MNYIDAYKILGVSPTDNIDKIKSSYKSKIKFYHPDNFHGDEEKIKYAEEMTKQINEAWDYIQSNHNVTNGDSYENEPVYEYNYESNSENMEKYTIYDRIYTNTMIKITTFILIGIVVLIINNLAKPIVEDFKLRREYSKADIAAMENYEFVGTELGLEIDTIHSNFSGIVEIPKTFDGSTVVSISDRAFKNCSGITEVIIPDTIVNIGRSAFANCDGLISVKIPDSVTNIVKVDFTDMGVFEGCDNLQVVFIGSGITSLTYHSFSGCDNLREIHLKSTIQEIRAYSFDGCEEISVIFYEGKMAEWEQIKIDDNAFENGVTFDIVCEDGTLQYPIQEQ